MGLSELNFLRSPGLIIYDLDVTGCDPDPGETRISEDQNRSSVGTLTRTSIHECPCLTRALGFRPPDLDEEECFLRDVFPGAGFIPVDVCVQANESSDARFNLLVIHRLSQNRQRVSDTVVLRRGRRSTPSSESCHNPRFLSRIPTLQMGWDILTREHSDRCI